MHTANDITGRGCYVLEIGNGPLVIRVDVLIMSSGRYTAYIDAGQSVPLDFLPALIEKLTAVQEQLAWLNGRSGTATAVMQSTRQGVVA